MKNKILLIIFIISLISSIIILSTVYGNSSFCEPNGGCNSVQNSKYGYLFGMSNSIYGIFIFLILSILTFSQMQKPKENKQLLIDSAVILGFIIAIYFIYLQIFVIKALCKYCLVVDGAMVLAFFLVILGEIKKNKRWR